MVNANWSQQAGRAFTYLVLILFALYFIMPLVVMVFNSLKDLAEIRTGNLILPPQSPTTEAWQKAWSSACTGLSCEGVSAYFWNSFKITLPAVVLASAIGAINGYVLAKWRFRGSEVFFALMLLGCFIPFQAVLLPMAQTLGYLGLANSVPGLILVHTIYGIPFTTLFYRNYYVGLPTELISAAKLDGAGFFQTFYHIVLPLSGPIIVVTLIWEFTNIWNDFLFGVVYSGPTSQPITVALNNLVNTSHGVKEYNVDMAAAIIAAIPTIFIYIISGKYFLRGLVAGAVKG
ncbi:carbohydrate ABC transporter permease [Photobacterium sp. WH77]|uniref:Carbohydrate ABC transporter permease n=1 Tax=Photobacterium arenosum TaxID=2774143 RepID=A0ABR9BMF5_9GAMM|nr:MULTISPECIES: carbohydrate ABC transporter permease [Photobacterium]MBD8513398.1 carbohydrate ABC transporter permease [Photobacterium arenosum]MBV7262315.1 carbohydrate ABC transporter permease [Photobacterium sp. WH24]MCG2839186.1 carbohydrate ABC transporter permease [Photobacterium sp. WH77]MCG2846803.1 carbohydrate ABC transporter permease [Photobacterium sp. WH80]MDO6583697.1 carbohydrate ABC transporter permease [Photobacterium sp. 2_MG-2023]